MGEGKSPEVLRFFEFQGTLPAWVLPLPDRPEFSRPYLPTLGLRPSSLRIEASGGRWCVYVCVCAHLCVFKGCGLPSLSRPPPAGERRSDPG